MGRGISLTRQSTALVAQAPKTALRLRVVAADAELMSAAVFLHQRRLPDPYAPDDTPPDEFVCVCTPFDLTTYPADEPADDQSPPFFRKSSLDILVCPGVRNQSPVTAEEALEIAWDAIHDAVCGLVADLDRLDVLTEADSTRCGDDPATSLSSSSSESG